MLKGIAASEGIGKVMIIEEHSLDYTPRTIADTDAEIKRYQDAIDDFCKETVEQADALRKSAGKKEAEILEGHIQMAKDPMMDGEVSSLIKQNKCAEEAVDLTYTKYMEMFAQIPDEMMKQRAADIKDIKTALLSILLGINNVKISDAPAGTVIVATEVTPSMTASINKDHIVGIITETGSQTSHSAILARALEIPAVLSVEKATASISSGENVIVDGNKGIVIVGPSGNEVVEYTNKRDAFLRDKRELENYRGKPTVSADGTSYELF